MKNMLTMTSHQKNASQKPSEAALPAVGQQEWSTVSAGGQWEARHTCTQPAGTEDGAAALGHSPAGPEQVKPRVPFAPALTCRCVPRGNWEVSTRTRVHGRSQELQPQQPGWPQPVSGN